MPHVHVLPRCPWLLLHVRGGMDGVTLGMPASSCSWGGWRRRGPLRKAYSMKTAAYMHAVKWPSPWLTISTWERGRPTPMGGDVEVCGRVSGDGRPTPTPRHRAQHPTGPSRLRTQPGCTWKPLAQKERAEGAVEERAPRLRSGRCRHSKALQEVRALEALEQALAQQLAATEAGSTMS